MKKGHLWIFSNEIADPPVSTLSPGEIHELRDASGEFLGMVYANPASLITARLLSRKRTAIDIGFFRSRIELALQRRQRLFAGRDTYRLIYAESDLLPGLIVDRYGEYLAVQSLTAGMELLQPLVIEALVEVVHPQGIYLRNDSPARSLEGLPVEKKTVYGHVPEIVEIASGKLKLLVDIPNGQKTGFFLDQEANRDLMPRFVWNGATVLDLFCYSGAWGLHAIAAGAERVVGVDSSRAAVKLAEENARLNGMEGRFDAVRDSVLDFLKKTHEAWDVIVLDPPAFIKSRAQIKDGRRGYIDLNRRAFGKLQPEGVLITCSCSHHIDQAEFEEILVTASVQSGRRVAVVDVRSQGPDHPVLLAMSETRYLKVVACRVV